MNSFSDRDQQKVDSFYKISSNAFIPKRYLIVLNSFRVNLMTKLTFSEIPYVRCRLKDLNQLEALIASVN